MRIRRRCRGGQNGVRKRAQDGGAQHQASRAGRDLVSDHRLGLRIPDIDDELGLKRLRALHRHAAETLHAKRDARRGDQPDAGIGGHAQVLVDILERQRRLLLQIDVGQAPTTARSTVTRSVTVMPSARSEMTVAMSTSSRVNPPALNLRHVGDMLSMRGTTLAETLVSLALLSGLIFCIFTLLPGSLLAVSNAQDNLTARSSLRPSSNRRGCSRAPS